VDALKLAVSELSNLKAIKYAPIVERAEITSESHLQFAKLSLVPAFLFFDPFGYKTLSVNMIQSILKNPGSECIFFFNYNRINPAIQNPVVRKIVDAIFGKARVDKLQAILPTLDNAGTEAAIIGALRLRCISGLPSGECGLKSQRSRVVARAQGKIVPSDILPGRESKTKSELSCPNNDPVFPMLRSAVVLAGGF
jgi:hypothetical protein